MRLDTLYELLSGLSRNGLQVAINGLWLGLALAGLAWILWHLARNRDAAMSYATWWLVLVAVVVSPFLLSASAGLPSFGSAIPAVIDTQSEPHEIGAIPVATATAAVAPQPVPRQVVWHPENTVRRESRLQPAPMTDSRVADYSLSAILLGLAPISLFGIWLCVSLALLGRLGRAFLCMSRMKRTAGPLPADLAIRVRSLVAETGFTRPVRIGTSTEIGFPMAAGLGDPTILIPANLIGRLMPAELDAVVLHELAHLRRWDDWTKLGQRLIEALAFFNPAVRWIGRRLDHERELACDDRVLAHTGQPTDYARCLTKLAELNSVGRGLLVPGAVVNRKFIFRRLDRVLSNDKQPLGRSSRYRMVAAAATVILALVAIVQVTPAVTLPFEPLSYSEFSGHIGSLVNSLAPAVDPAETVNNADETAVAESSDVAPFQSTLPSSTRSGVSSQSSRSFSSSNGRRSASYYRAVDWNDKVFDVLVTGTIHMENNADLIAWASEDGKFQAAMRGRLRFDPSDLTLQRIYDGGFLAIRDLKGDSRRELDIRSDSDGDLIYDFYVDGWAAEFDRDARNWLAEVLVRMVPDLLESMEPLEETDSDAGGVRKYYGYTDSPANGLVYNSASAAAGDCSYVSVYDPTTGVVQTVNSGDPKTTTVTTSYVNGLAQQFLIEQDDAGPMLVDLSGDGQYYAFNDEADDENDDENDKSAKSKRHSKGILSKAANWIEQAFDGNWMGTSISVDDFGRTEITINDGRTSVKLEYEGDIEFADDDSDIKSMSDDAYFYLAEKSGRDRQEIEIQPGKGGELEYSYFEDRDDAPFDDRARKWFSRCLAYAVRNTGVNAEARVDRWYEAGGVKRVLDEFDDIERDYARSEHIKALLKHDLSSDEYSQVLGYVARNVESDYEKAELLIALADRNPPDQTTIGDYLGVVETLDSDYETRRVLGAVLFDDNVDADVAARLLRIAGRMESDYEKAELLVDWADQMSDSPQLLARLLDVVAMIDSDYETRRVLSRISIDENADDETILAVLRIAGDMDSDYEKAELLIQMAPLCRDSGKLEAAYMEAVGDIDSDYETRRILSALGNRRKLEPATAEDMLAMIHHLDSDYEKAELLIDLSRSCDDNPELRSSFVSAAATLDSDYETKRVLSSLDYDCVKDAALVTEIMATVEDMSSDYETAELLTSLADCAEDSPEVRAAYFRAVKRISSDYEKRRCLSPLTDIREMDETRLTELLSAIVTIDSDFEKGELLKQLIPQCRGNDRYEDLMVDAIETIDSEYTINELYAKLYRRSTHDVGLD